MHQAISCGVLLPVIGFYAQAGSLYQFPLVGLIPLSLLFFASNIITALPDLASDAEGGKHTYPVRHGLARAMSHALILLIAANGAAFALNVHWQFDQGLNLLLALPALVLLVCAIPSLVNKGPEPEKKRAVKQFMVFTISCQVWLLITWTILLFWQGMS